MIEDEDDTMAEAHVSAEETPFATQGGKMCRHIILGLAGNFYK